MNKATIKIKAQDGLLLQTYKWLPSKENNLKAILLLVHGSVEHAMRYQQFGNFLTQNKIGVYTFDMRGHGQTTDIDADDFAHIPYKTGWSQLLEDIHSVQLRVQKDYPNVPIFLFGHSMGSFLVRDYVASKSSNISGLLLSGTTYGNRLEAEALVKVAEVLALFQNPKNKSEFLHKQIYGKLNKSIKNPKTPVDFISTDDKEVKKYLADKLSGQTISIGYAHEMGKGLLRIRKQKSINKIPKDLPILIISGQEDPVGGNNGKDVKKLYNKYKQNGISNVSLKLYKDARHEILNDSSRDEVMIDILNWINKNLSK